MKAILVVDMPEEYTGSIIDVVLYGNNRTIHERYVNKLKPMPKRMIEVLQIRNENIVNILNVSFANGWNACLGEITK